MRSPQFIQVETNDGLTLPGLFYEAENSQEAAIYLHGNGSSSVFYSDDTREKQAKTLNSQSISYLLFNNRGAHYIKNLEVKEKKESKRFGMAYEKIKDCIQDIDGAISFLRKKGYTKFYLIGESTGANKICVYHFYKPENEVSRYILLAGADDVGIYYTLLGRENFYKLLAQAKEKITQNKGEEIMCELLPNEIFSYAGFYDLAYPDGDYNVFPFLEVMQGEKLSTKKLFRYFQSINKPTLVVYGEKDRYCYENVPRVVNVLKELQPSFVYKIIPNSDHVFSTHQNELAEVIVEWLKL
jgi:pimeloyl-ACP methyl ester carboxylesterase